jgi:hypothetical protein
MVQLTTIEKLSFGIIIAFALIGLIVISTIIHEYSHFYDLKNEVKTQAICGLVLPQNLEDAFNPSNSIGTYTYSVKSDNLDIIEQIEKTTEIKAYSINLIIFLIFDIFLAIAILSLRKK